MKSNLRKYGEKPFNVVVLHGGPGAPGEMAPVARELSSIRGVLEPLQTSDSIKGQSRELNDVLKEHADLPVTLIGWSWGAMLGFIFAAQFPSFVAKLNFVSGPPFADKYAVGIMETRLNRLNKQDRAEVLSIMGYLDNPSIGDKNKLMARLGKLLSKADSYDPLPYDDDILECQYDIYQKVWKEAGEMRSSGQILELGKKIKCPVVAIHGDYDPHPAEGVREPLSRTLKAFRFILLDKCGHKPWIEKQAAARFYDFIRSEI